MRPSMIFEIQKIIGVSTSNGNVRNFHVQWAPCWVSDHHLVGCENLIEEFLHGPGDICDQQSEDLPDVNHIDAMDTAFDLKEEVSEQVNNQVPDDDDADNDIFIARETEVIDFEHTLDSGGIKSLMSTKYNAYSKANEFALNQAKEVKYESYVESSPPSFSGNQECLDRSIKIEIEENHFVENDPNDFDAQTQEESVYLTPTFVNTASIRQDDNNKSNSIEGNSDNNISLHTNRVKLPRKRSIRKSKISERNVLGHLKGKRKRKDIDKTIKNKKTKVPQPCNKKSAGNDRSSKVLKPCDKKTFNNKGSKIIEPSDNKTNKRSSKILLKRTCNTNGGLICEVCGKQFTSSNNKNFHIRSQHLGETRYECSYCGKKSFFKHEFQRHVRTHTGEKPFECHKCHKWFTRPPKERGHKCSK